MNLKLDNMDKNYHILLYFKLYLPAHQIDVNFTKSGKKLPVVATLPRYIIIVTNNF